MSAWGALSEAFNVETQRLSVVRAERKPRKSPLVALGGVLAMVLHFVTKLRTEVLALGGLGFIVTGAWLFSPITGCLAAGVSLFYLEWLLRDE